MAKRQQQNGNGMVETRQKKSSSQVVCNKQVTDLHFAS